MTTSMLFVYRYYCYLLFNVFDYLMCLTSLGKCVKGNDMLYGMFIPFLITQMYVSKLLSTALSKVGCL